MPTRAPSAAEESDRALPSRRVASRVAEKTENFPRTSLDSFQADHPQLSHRCGDDGERSPSPRTETSSAPFPRAPGGADVRCVSGCSWQGAISMAKKKKKAAKKVAKKKKGHG
jgi:hypothetical protein